MEGVQNTPLIEKTRLKNRMYSTIPPMLFKHMSIVSFYPNKKKGLGGRLLNTSLLLSLEAKILKG